MKQREAFAAFLKDRQNQRRIRMIIAIFVLLAVLMAAKGLGRALSGCV